MTKRSKKGKKDNRIRRSSLSLTGDEEQSLDFPIVATATNTESTPSTSRPTDWTDRLHRTIDASSTPGLSSHSSSGHPSSSVSLLERLEAPGAPKSNRRLILPIAIRDSSREIEGDTSRNSASIPEENQVNFEEEADSLHSALSGSHPGGSIGYTTSEDSVLVSKALASNLKRTATTSKMATALFDTRLELLMKKIMRYDLADNIPLAIQQHGITTFEEFRSIDLDLIPTFMVTTVIAIKPFEARQIRKILIYCLFKEENNDIDRDDPAKWDVRTFEAWSRNGPALYLQNLAQILLPLAPLATPSAGISGAPYVVITQQEKLDDAALVSWNRKPRDLLKYPIIKDDAYYQDFELKMKRQLLEDKLSRVTDPKFSVLACRPGSDRELATLQVNYFEQILSAVLQNAEGKGLVTTHPTDSLYVWQQHEIHQRSSDSAQINSTAIMTKLLNLKMADSPTRHEFLISFQDTCNRYDTLAGISLTTDLKKTLLQKAIVHDVALLNSWNTVNEVKRAINPGAPAASYGEFYNFLVNQSKTHDLATPIKRSQRHANQTRFDTFEDGSNDHDNDEDSVLNEVIAHMSVQDQPMSEEVVSALQVFSTFQRRRNGPARQRDPEAEIPQPLYSEVSRELKSAWSREDNKIKKRILQCKQQVPKKDVKKNSELGVYMIESEGYASDSDASAYSDATYAYDNDNTEDATGETSDNSGTDLTVNAAASRQRRPTNGGILKRRIPVPKKSDLAVGDPRRFLSNKQIPFRDEDGKIIGHITYAATMARLNRFDEIKSPVSIPNQGSYVISASATRFFNEPLALMDGGANGGIGGRDMKLMSYNADGRRVNIGIAGDHQMTGKRLGTFCSVIHTQLGRVLGIFHQYAHVPEQAKSIHSRCQFQSHGNLVGDTATRYGGPQRIDTSDGYQLPLSIRSGLPYISQTYPTAEDMNLPQVEFTSPTEWNPDAHDDNRTTDEMIRQFPAVPRDAANEFYDLEGNVNLEHLRSARNAEIMNDAKSDTDSIDPDMPGLQPRQHEDTSSDDDSDNDRKLTRAPTTMLWKDPIDDANGEKFTCQKVRKGRARRNEKRLANRRKKAEIKLVMEYKKKELKKVTKIVENSTETVIDDDMFYPTDPHPFRTGTIIEDKGLLFQEREMDGLLFYDTLEVLDDPDKTLDIIKDCTQYWTLCSEAKSLQSDKCFVDTVSDTDYLNDLSIPRVTEHEYWNDWLLDDTSRRIIAQGAIDDCLEYNINANDIAAVMNPLQPRMTTPSDMDYESKRKYFAHLPASVVKATFKHTTQNMKLPPSTYLHKMFKSPNPSANLKRRDEADATDQIFSDTPAINGGEKSAHLFVGKKSKLTDAYKSKDSSSAEFLKCLQDRVRFRGCPTGLEADNAPMYRGWKNSVYHRDVILPLWQCESKYQHQNYAENRWQTVKRYTNRVMDRSGCPPYIWFLALSYVIFCLNHCVDPNLADGKKSPLQVATFLMTDISPLLYFYFWQPVYFLEDESQQSFPSESKELRGRWVGISEHIGNRMTYKIITDDTGEEVCRSAIRSALDPTMKNLREDPIEIQSVPISVEDIISPADAIYNQIKSDSMNDLQTGHFSKPVTETTDDNQRSHFHQKSSPTSSPMHKVTPHVHAPKLLSTNKKQRHVRAPKLRDLHPKDPTTVPHRYPIRNNRTVKSGQTLTFSDDTNLEDVLPTASDDDDDNIGSNVVDNFAPPTDPTAPSTELQQQFLRTRDTHIDDQPDSFVYLRDNGENENPIWKEFEVTLKDGNGNVKLGPDGKPMIAIAPPASDLCGRVFLTKPNERGEVNRARVVELIKDFEGKISKDKDLIKFKLKYDHSDLEDVMSYNEILDYVEREHNNEDGHHWKFRTILGHIHTPVGHKDRMGSDYNVRTGWETGAVSVEPLDFLAKDIPVDLAMYAKKHDLLEKEGWKRFKRIANRDQHLQRLVKQAKLRSFRVSPKYKYGFAIPRNYKEALEFDERNGNTKWQDANAMEHDQLSEYEVFIDKGKFHEGKIPEGYRKIKVHTIFDVKHDGRHKARVVANGNLTDVPLESVYSGVVSLRGLRTCIFLGELNKMTPWATDIGNAYLEAKTTEKVCIRAGPEFGELQGNLLIIDKALYGLRLSGKAFNQLLSDCLRDLGFYPSKAESSIFMRKCPTRDAYEYVATYVDDLCIIMEDPESFLKQLSSAPYNFKLKGSGEVNFHLGCGFERDSDGVLCMNPSRYVDKMEEAYKQYFKEMPNQKHRSPLVKGDHPELDTSEFLDQDGIDIYQSLIGAMQWAISIGRWDIQSAVMTLSSFRAQPRQGHLDRIKRTYGFLCRFRHFKLRFRVDEPDISAIPDMQDYDWEHSVYGNPTEDIPKDAPPPLGKRIILTHYYDANLMHDVLSGKAVTGVVHFYNKTPVDWYCKKQSTSETATYGSEFLACRTCFEQIIDHRQYLRYLGAPVYKTDYTWGDNDAQINSATIPDAKLHKRHNILSFHFVRSMIACGYINLQHIKSECNIADILTKHWGYQGTYELIRPIFHFGGNTAGLYLDDTLEVDRVLGPEELEAIITINGEC